MLNAWLDFLGWNIEQHKEFLRNRYHYYRQNGLEEEANKIQTQYFELYNGDDWYTD